MGTKNAPGKFDCYAALADDEPYFVLRAKDAMSPHLVRQWANNRRRQIELGIKPKEATAKAVEAERLAAAMEVWRGRNA